MASCSSSSSPPPPIPLLFLLLVSLLAATFLAPQALAQQQPQEEGGGGNATAAWAPRLRKTFLDGGAGMLPRRRRLVGRFQICAVCSCCGGPHGVCIPAPCCYAINCNIPNRPFGVCSFTPRTCNCLNCHL
ncbi:uncharacterized protein LOC107305260 isoform X2 [Oryza brachyantha]|uniref:uncharacterized protein LOC107305260 isoform X2 n=1 Tax=Oryza brachyantha TaxID=4533 RepID=UPI00077636C0|nr:uncharacterized protein LOC107305260 isoform X2 [Oryza brachyantha]